jgi:hypothetical protein
MRSLRLNILPISLIHNHLPPVAVLENYFAAGTLKAQPMCYLDPWIMGCPMSADR